MVAAVTPQAEKAEASAIIEHAGRLAAAVGGLLDLLGWETFGIDDTYAFVRRGDEGGSWSLSADGIELREWGQERLVLYKQDVRDGLLPTIMEALALAWTSWLSEGTARWEALASAMVSLSREEPGGAG